MISPFRKQWKVSLLLAGVVWLAWLAVLGPSRAFATIVENWRVSLMMVFGSLVGGGTSEGGGSVAFPVMTKVLHFAPRHAAVFALAIQSIGMTAASVAIAVMRVPVEWRAVLWSGIGGAVGIVAGSWWCTPLVAPDVTRIVFTSMVGSFALTLTLLNRNDPHRNVRIPAMGGRERGLLLVAGAIGGVLTALVGTGIDIVVFSVIVLLFRVDEKVATPTTVVLQSAVVIVGSLFHALVMRDVAPVVRHAWLAAIPVVVVGAPAGAMLCARMSRETIVRVVLFLIAVEVVSTLVIVPTRPALAQIGVGATGLLAAVYYALYRAGFRRGEATPAPAGGELVPGREPEGSFE